ncbi:3-ketoacyl-ACP reductase [Treponema parvum]|uniref:3-ketoacyl-ACP reductase n=1 Tax=Treponema parvum TaxID=138851 RepID=A0A975F1L6_9SPIR|nr:3-ketoacyl-ACP reductase [Treponema parvum]QTQ12625.1 3-ketoacyl-ACP reductase [Treponema parvum]
MKKTAVITGASRGIGFAIARKLGKDGFNVVIVATGSKEKNQENMDTLTADKTKWAYVRANIADRDDRLRIVREAVDAFGRIDVLVNNAGVAPLVRSDLLEMTEESFDRVIGINTKGTMFLTQAVAKQMLKQEILGKKRGTIINISSCSAEVSSISRGEYCVSKAGVSMLTTLYADRLAKEGILVHEIRPGVIATDMTLAVTEKYDKLIGDGLFPIARWGSPEDIAAAVSAFADDHFLYTTGNYVDVDGGFHIKRL